MASVRLRLSPRLPLSLTTATEATVVDMEATADTVLATAGATMASERLRPSPTTATEGTEAMVATATAGATESVRPRLSPRLPLSLTTATEATVVDMEATADTVLATAGATMASVRLRPSPTMATEGTEATVVDTEAMVDTATAG